MRINIRIVFLTLHRIVIQLSVTNVFRESVNTAEEWDAMRFRFSKIDPSFVDDKYIFWRKKLFELKDRHDAMQHLILRQSILEISLIEGNRSNTNLRLLSKLL